MLYFSELFSDWIYYDGQTNLIMYDRNLHPRIHAILAEKGLGIGEDLFYARIMANAGAIQERYQALYLNHPNQDEGLEKLIRVIADAARNRPAFLKEKDAQKAQQAHWFLSNQLAGMSLYVDRFCNDLKQLRGKLDYFQKLGVNLLHLLPIFQSPANESEDGYAGAGFRKVDKRFGSLEDLKKLVQKMNDDGMYLMLDLVLHQDSLDLNDTTPGILCEMLDTLFFYANLGVDVLGLDTPASRWKQLDASYQNLPETHNFLQLIKLCVESATPGMALVCDDLGAPKEIVQYFGTGRFSARECDFAYNVTQMAAQWDALATGNVRLMLASQRELLQKPYGSSWLTYTRSKDDIGLEYEDEAILQAGFTPFEHRKFIQDYYSGAVGFSPARGALSSFNPKTRDARISGTLASLCGLEQALEQNNEDQIELAVRRILLMQALSFFIGGVPMIFYGDELGYTNDYSYRNDPSKSHDHRWMHRPLIDWKKNALAEKTGTIEHRIFTDTQRLLSIRKSMPVLTDTNNLLWFDTHHHHHVAGFIRTLGDQKLCCLFNFSDKTVHLYSGILRDQGIQVPLFDHWRNEECALEVDGSFLKVEPYAFYLLEAERT